MEKELFIRCGQENPYGIQTPIALRHYFVEGTGNRVRLVSADFIRCRAL